MGLIICFHSSLLFFKRCLTACNITLNLNEWLNIYSAVTVVVMLQNNSNLLPSV